VGQGRSLGLPVKVTVFVSPKSTVLDPQGAAVEHAMKSLGHASARGVRVGKTITFEIDGEDGPDTRKKLDELCDGLLSNPIIEDFRYEID
jgi:phosphoribosylformylglycinamidine synthase PurS subunit